jgi:hypothetical protein
MKKLFVCLLAVTIVFGVATFAQDASQAGQAGQADKASAAPLKTIDGTIKITGDKATFVSDSDQKSWEIVNPDAVKGHDGHHVQVSAHVYADKNAIHVMSVTMKDKS